MRSDSERKGVGTEQLDLDDPEPTGRATPVVVERVSAKPRAATKAKSKAPSSKRADSVPAPKSRRAPVNVSTKKAGASANRKSLPPPRSRRAPARVQATGEASIPPTWSDVGERGEPVASAEVSPILPAPMPTLVGAHDADDAVVPVPVRSSWLSPYARAAAGIAAALCLVFVGRGIVRRTPHPVPASTSLAVAAAAVEPAPVEPPAEPTLEAITPPVDTSPDTAEGLKHASLDALEHRKLDEAVAAGEQSTQLDPTDADAWLILGAAYHDQGNFLAARRSYAACAKQATRGEVRECKFLLQ